jgi:hypothetical protein
MNLYINVSHKNVECIRSTFMLKEIFPDFFLGQSRYIKVSPDVSRKNEIFKNLRSRQYLSCLKFNFP